MDLREKAVGHSFYVVLIYLEFLHTAKEDVPFGRTDGFAFAVHFYRPMKSELRSFGSSLIN